MTAETIADLHEIGYFRFLQPSAFGGENGFPLPFFEATLELAPACPSSAWVGCLLGIHNWMIAFFDERAQHDIWDDDPRALIASSLAPAGTVERTEGGFILEGTWPFSSGSDHCSWAICTGIDTEGGGMPYAFLVPATDYKINDNWHVAGLRGTGSKELMIDRAFVPEHRAESYLAIMMGTSRGLQGQAAPTHRVPFMVTFCYGLAVPAMGTALGAITDYSDRMAKRIAAYTGEKLRDRAATHIRLAEASGEVDAALQLFRRDFEVLQAAASAGVDVPTPDSLRARFNAGYCLELSARAVDRLYRASGGRAIFDDSRMQQYFRDIHAMTQHGQADFDAIACEYGKVLLGSISSAARRADRN